MNASVGATVGTQKHALIQNDDRITTHSQRRSGNSGAEAENEREQCNISIRQEQAPLAKNEFVRTLDRPCCYRDSGRAEFNYLCSGEKEKKKTRHIVQFRPMYALGTESTAVKLLNSFDQHQDKVTGQYLWIIKLVFFTSNTVKACQRSFLHQSQARKKKI